MTETEPVRRSARRRRVTAVAGCLLLAGAVIAGVSITVDTVRNADRDAGAPRWKFPKTAAEEKKASASTGLAGMLVPYGDDWFRGPDLAEFGSDAQLSGAQATALRKEALRGLPRSLRKEVEKHIDRQRTKGMAMRSYYSGVASGLSRNDGLYSANVLLAQLGDRAAVREMAESQRRLFALGRKGPKVEGHKDAACFLGPEGDEEELVRMYCSGHAGDVLVTVTAYGDSLLDTEEVAGLMRTQLDRIAEPGKAI